MECPYCEKELIYQDYYYTGRPEGFFGTVANGIHYKQSSDYKKLGDIYKCFNEECQRYQEHFYTDMHGDIHEGYPC